MATLILLWGMLTGCKSEYQLIPILDPVSGTEIYILEEDFQQIKTVSVNPVVDVLIVMDNSGSMSPLQTELKNALPSLVSDLDANVPDYRIGVVTTDMYNVAQSGRLIRTANGSLWVDSNDSVATQTSEFMSILNQVTTWGSSWEQGRDAAYAAVGPEYVNSATGTTVVTEAENYNAGFRRPEADLDLLIISDERDSSITDPLDTDYLADISEFTNQLQNEATANGTQATLSIITDMSGCGTGNDEYVELFNIFNTTGVGYQSDVCNPASSVQNIWTALAREPLQNFFLTAFPKLNENFKIIYTPDVDPTRDDEPLTEVETVYGDPRWSYYEPTKMVYFSDTALPASETAITVQYEVDRY